MLRVNRQRINPISQPHTHAHAHTQLLGRGIWVNGGVPGGKEGEPVWGREGTFFHVQSLFQFPEASVFQKADPEELLKGPQGSGQTVG